MFGLRCAKHTSVPILSFNGGNKFRLWQFYAALRIDVPLGTTARRRLFWSPHPFGGAPTFGDWTCSAEVNSACAKVLLRKTLGTPDSRRCEPSLCGANLSRTFFPFPKRTVGLIDKCAGFWYDERMKRWICRCTLPIQGLLRRLTGLQRYAPSVAPYLSRYHPTSHQDVGKTQLKPLVN